jgi:hypothetical protein
MALVSSDVELQDFEENTTQANFDPNEVKEALRHNMEFLIQFFMHEKISVDVPEFHLKILTLLTTFTVSKFALAVPRGHAKTTLVKIAIVYYFLFTDIRFVLYVSNTSTVAKDEVRDVINFLLSENFVAVFGKVEWEKRNESDGLYIFQLGKKRCILRALGAGQQVRGLNIDNERPELLICDDAEDDENSETPTQRSKLRRWVYGPLFKACARHSKKVWIGNLVSSNCLINDLCESKFWSSIKYGCILANGQPLWPEMFSLSYLKQDYIEYQQAGMTAKWFAEMMNMPVPEGMGLITAEEIQYRPARTSGDLKYGFITIDPAISNKTWANNTSIVVHGFVEDLRQWQVVDYVLEKGVDPIKLINKTVDLCFKWRIATIGIETIAYQAALEPMFNYILAQRQLFGIAVIPLHSTNSKASRIITFASWLKTGAYALTEGEFSLTNQLLKYDPTKKENDDDLVDGAAYGPQMIDEHLNLVLTGSVMKDVAAQGQLAICGV